MKQRNFSRTLLAVAFSAFGASTFAQVPEAEPNHPITSAQQLSLSGGVVSVTGNVGGTTNTDVDFFAVSVTAPNDEAIKVDIAPTGSDVLVFLLAPWDGSTFPLKTGSFNPGFEGPSAAARAPATVTGSVTASLAFATALCGPTTSTMSGSTTILPTT